MSGLLSFEMECLRTALADTPRIVLDLDGTLYDTRDFERPALASVVRWLRERSGLPLTGAERELWWRRESDRHRPGLFDELLRRYGLPAEWGAHCAQTFHEYPGDELARSMSLMPLLMILREQGQKLALVSNGHPEVQARKLSTLNLINLFDIRIFCDPRKPEELKPSAWAWRQLDTWRADAALVYVGDDPVDAAFAAAGGVGYVQFSFRKSYHDH